MEKKLKEKLPKLPGVYIFKDILNNVIYIGKAKHLQKRVSSYFVKQNTDWKVQDLINEYESVEHIVTKNEIEALLLEAQLIKEYSPKFNVLLKTGNPFLYILITNDELPEIKLVRQKKGKGVYFGPFLQKGKTRSTFSYLTRIFKLNLCNTIIENGCLDYHIGICAGNCKSNFDLNGYLLRLNLAEQVLNNKYEKFEQLLKQNIAEYNKNFDFEKSKNLNQYLIDSKFIFDTIETGFSTTKYRKEIAQATSPGS